MVSMRKIVSKDTLMGGEKEDGERERVIGKCMSSLDSRGYAQ